MTTAVKFQKRTNMPALMPATKSIGLYLDLLARILDGTLIKDPPLVTGQGYSESLRESGLDWPSTALTMIGSKRLRNLRMVMEDVIHAAIPGDFVETGVWRGGASIYARAIMAAYEVSDRKVICCDSFEGLPAPNEVRYPADCGSPFHQFSELAVSLDEVKSNFNEFDLLDAQVLFLKGWFSETMPKVPSKQIAVLRLDGDMYQSTIDPLLHLYDRIPNGGWVIVDDYHMVPAAKQAVEDFLESRNEKQNFREIDGVGICFCKNDSKFS